jgi:hypothetical protein
MGLSRVSSFTCLPVSQFEIVVIPTPNTNDSECEGIRSGPSQVSRDIGHLYQSIGCDMTGFRPIPSRSLSLPLGVGMTTVGIQTYAFDRLT